jgi:hypothetical protein
MWCQGRNRTTEISILHPYAEQPDRQAKNEISFSVAGSCPALANSVASSPTSASSLGPTAQICRRQIFLDLPVHTLCTRRPPTN